MKNLNETVLDFEYRGRKFEVDKLLDASANGFEEFDIFDVTDGQESVGHLTLDEGALNNEIEEQAKYELDKLDEEWNNLI